MLLALNKRRVFCKKGCDTDGDSLEDCLNDCNEICYKDPVIKDHQWSAYIDRSPGQDDNSEECFNACITGCSFKFNETVDGVHPKRPPKPEIVKKPPSLPAMEIPPTDDVTATSA
ncbi:hypothetical protein SUGI_0031630 [Cryptomeria japonica]|nr:hypothetical protein SUGI_0031630 [Cryptomeria japonica]